MRWLARKFARSCMHKLARRLARKSARKLELERGPARQSTHQPEFSLLDDVDIQSRNRSNIEGSKGLDLPSRGLGQGLGLELQEACTTGAVCRRFT